MIFKLECKYHSPINLLIYCWQVWKFALAKKGPKSSVISAPVFPGSPGSWLRGVLSLAEFTHKGSKQQNCQMESLPSDVFSLSFGPFLPVISPLFFLKPLVKDSLQGLPCSFIPHILIFLGPGSVAPALLTAKKQKWIWQLIHEFLQSKIFFECGYSRHNIPGARKTAPSTLESLLAQRTPSRSRR